MMIIANLAIFAIKGRGVERNMATAVTTIFVLIYMIAIKDIRIAKKSILFSRKNNQMKNLILAVKNIPIKKFPKEKSTIRL